MVDKIQLNREALKAIVADSRYDIIKLLSEKDYTLSEISEKLKLSKPTVKEHLEVLCKNGIICKEDTERKWKYFSLTEIGSAVIQKKEVKVLFVFMLNAIILVGTVAFGFIRYIFPKKVETFGTARVMSAEVEMVAHTAMDTAAATFPTEIVAFITFLTIISFTTGLLLGLYIKKQKIYAIIKEKKK